MRRILMAAVAAGLLATTACGGHKPPKATPVAGSHMPASPHAPAAASSPAAATPVTMAWGTRAYTVGSQHPFQSSATPGAPLLITPMSVVYATRAPAETPAAGMFVIVVAKDEAPHVAAVGTAPATGGGWTWIAPDGRSTSTMSGNANQVILTGLNGDVAPAGAYAMTTEVFDVPASAKGGTLLYTDGAGVAFRWKVPAANTGPQVTEVEKDLAQ